jgi:hypothetical protein
VYRTDDALVRGRGRRSGSAVLWRSGRVLALVFVAGRGGGQTDEALRLAGAQQRRIAEPTPLVPADNDDRQVPLDDPRLSLPVWWLGESFPAPEPLPALVLEDALALGGGPGWRADIDYERAQGGPGVTIALWRPRAFARFKATRLGRLVRGQRCARRTPVGLPGGRAVIYAGYADPPRRCARRAPDRYLAHVFLDGTVVTVNVPACLLCVRGAESGPYNSEAGMRAVVEGLRARP